MSLRTLLLFVSFVAVTIGGMRWLLFWDFEVFQVVLVLLTTIVPFVLAIGTIFWLGIRGRRLGLALWGGTLLFVPLLGLCIQFVLPAIVGSRPGGMGLVSTAQLIQTRLPQQMDEPWVWRELEARLQAGNLSPQQADAAVQALVAHMTKTRPAGWDQPLSWQREFLQSAIRAGAISDPVLFALCDAFYGPKPLIQPLERIREGIPGLEIQVKYGSTWASHTSLGVQLLWHVERVLVDGKPIAVKDIHRFSQEWRARHPGSFEAGDHEVTVEVQCAYVDEAKLIGLDVERLEMNRWPKPRKQWLQTVSAPFKVYPQGQLIVGLDTDPARDPSTTGGVKVQRLVVQSAADGGKSVILKMEFAPGLSIPVSCDVSAVVGNQSLHLGMIWVAQDGKSRRGGGSQLQARIAELDSAIQSADIILKPNPVHIERIPGVEKIWGKPIILRGVPLERLDLEAGGELLG